MTLLFYLFLSLVFLKKDLSWLTTIIYSFKYLSDRLFVFPAKLWDRNVQQGGHRLSSLQSDGGTLNS